MTTSIDTEKGLDLVLPPWNEETIDIPKDNITNLLINAQGQVLLDNEIVEIGEISSIIKDKIFENELLIVSVKTDKETKYDTYVDVLDQLKKAEARRISLAEPDEE